MHISILFPRKIHSLHSIKPDETNRRGKNLKRLRELFSISKIEKLGRKKQSPPKSSKKVKLKFKGEQEDGNIRGIKNKNGSAGSSFK